MSPWLLLVAAGCAPDPDPETNLEPELEPSVDLVWSAPAGDGLGVFVRQGGQTRHLPVRGYDAYVGPVSPAGDAVVVVSVGPGEASLQQLWLHPLRGGAPTALSAPARQVRNPRWAPDGSAVVYESSVDGFRDIYRASRQGAVTRLSRSRHGCFEPTPLGDGTRAIASCSGGEVELFWVEGDQLPPRRLLARPGEDGPAALSPDGATLAWLAEYSGSRSVRTLALDTGEHEVVWRPGPTDGAIAPSAGLSWAPDGRSLAVVAVGTQGPQVVVVHLHADMPPTRIPGDLPAWRPQGGLLVSGSDSVGEGLFLSEPVGTPPRRVSPAGAWLGRPL